MNFDKILETAQKIFSNSLVKSVLVIIISFGAYKLISALLNARGKRLKKLDRKKSETYIKLINSTVKYAVLIIAFFSLLSVNNVNITSMLAGLGIAGIVLGVAVQDALKDIIRGFDIVSDNYFKVGDLIEVNDKEGIVSEIGIKTTKIKDIKTDNIISIPNREITQAALVSKLIYIDIPMPYETPLDVSEKVSAEICKEIEKSADVKSCVYVGINKLDNSSVNHYIKLECKNNAKKLQIRRDALGTVLEVMANNKISVPYQQIDIHNK